MEHPARSAPRHLRASLLRGPGPLAAALLLGAFGCSGGGGKSGFPEPTGGTGGVSSSGGESAGGLSSGGTLIGFGGTGTGGASGGSGGTGLLDGKEGASLEQQAKSTFRPIDVIFVIDNSGSMSGEIDQVQARVNDDFARIIEASGLDYRVILLSRYGKVGTEIGQSNHPVCIGSPLGPNDCSDPMHTPLANSARFFHFSADIESTNGWCAVLDGWQKPDEWGDAARSGWQSVAPGGWSSYARPEAFKVFVMVTDDDVDCDVGGRSFDDQSSVSHGENAATAFDAALLSLSPEHFGSAAERRYVWHSIVAMQPNADPREAWLPGAPVQTERCSPGSDGPGTGHQALSRLTGGLRYPTCNNENFDAIFNAIALGIVGGAKLNCDWEIPMPPDGAAFDAGKVNVRYTPGDGSAAEDVLFVPALDDCGASPGWHYDDVTAPTRVVACPVTCEQIEDDAAGRIDVLFGCKTQGMVVK